MPIRFFEKNEFLINLKANLKNYKKFVLIASNPTNYEQNDLFLNMDIKALKLSGITFKEYIVLDNRNKNEISNILDDSDLIFLCGGNTYVQNLFFNEIKLEKYIKKNESIVVGISAGAINSAKKVYNSPECKEDLLNPCILSGLGITTINIEPHFVLDDVNDENKKIQREAIIKESYNKKIYALTDGAYILEDFSTKTIFGKCYLIYKGNINMICNDNEKYIIIE